MTLSIEGLGTRHDAVEALRPFAPSAESEPKSELEAVLRAKVIADVMLGIDDDAFQDLSDKYGTLVDQADGWIDTTAHNFDKDGVPEDGHIRKELKFNDAGMQISDPKNLFHFNNDLIAWWNQAGRRDSKAAPKLLHEFMRDGIDLHGQLVSSARNLLGVLDESYPGMKDFYFPGELSHVTFRLLRYDGYDLYDENGKLVVEENAQVAKPHFDRGGVTLQAYSSAPGFWYQDFHNRGPGRPKFYPEHGPGKSQMFFGVQHRVAYGSKDNINDLYHGVDKIFDTSEQRMPVRTAAIAFIDTPTYDLSITSLDTQPDRADTENLNI